MRSRYQLYLLLTLILLTEGCLPSRYPTIGLTPQSQTKSCPNCEYVLQGEVNRVLDGDTLDLVDRDRHTFRIRLKGIDAPEKTQAYGPKAKALLTKLVLNQNVHISWNEKDMYGRLIGKVSLNDKDICLAMVAAGLAWHFTKYEQSQTDADRQLYKETEKRVREQHKGLWADPSPVPPWQYRQQQRQENEFLSSSMNSNGKHDSDGNADDQLVDLTLNQMEETARVADLPDLALILEIRKDGLDDDPRVYELLNRVNPNWLDEPDDSDGTNPTHVSLCIPLAVAYNQVSYDQCRCEADIAPCVYCACRAAIFRATKDDDFRPRPRAL